MATNTLSTGSRKASRRPLILAIVFGALSALLVLTYLQSLKSSDKPTTTVATAPVVFAVRDIPERTEIKEGMLEMRQIPVDAKHNLALTSKDLAVGKLTRVPISAGEQLLSTKLAGEVKDVGFSGTIPEGKRAVAVSVTEVIASGGHITPGDYVDVIGVFQVHIDPNKQQNFGPSTSGAPTDSLQLQQQVYTAVTVLQHVQVLAVAQNADQNITPTNGKAPTPTNDQAHSVTLSVSPDDAEKLFLAEEIGKLRLSLRPFNEDDQRKVQPVMNTLQDIVGN
jgi:pilus assembly protein CpaB